MTEPRFRRFSADSNSADQVLRLFLDLDIAVAQHPERTLAPHPVARETAAIRNADHGLEPDEADRPCRRPCLAASG